MTELRTLAEFDTAVADHRHVLITDKANGDKVHKFPCSSVRREHFEEKVVRNGGKNGRYYLLSDLPEAVGADRCPHC